MQLVVSPRTYHRFATGIGVLLTLMGVGILGMFALFLLTGTNALASLGVGALGVLLVASIGALALPLGASLFGAGPDTPGRLRTAAFGLGLLGVVRLLAFTQPDIRAVAGFALLGEFFVLGGVSLLALVLRPGPER